MKRIIVMEWKECREVGDDLYLGDWGITGPENGIKWFRNRGLRPGKIARILVEIFSDKKRK